MDILSNGDVFLHDIKMVNAQKELPSSVVPFPNSPGYEPSVRPVRVARKPEIKPRVGIMCPSCHQSRVGFYDMEKSDNSSFSMVLIFGFDDETLYVFRTSQLIEAATAQLFDSDSKEIKEIETGAELNSIWVAELKELLRNSDKILISLTEASTMTLQDLACEWEPNRRLLCPMCGKIHSIQEWINEYAYPKAKYHDVCKICGGEMVIVAAEGFIGEANGHQMKCEVCEYETNPGIKGEP